MANKSVFASLKGKMLPKADARNSEGAPAYAYGAEHKLAQLAMTGTFGASFYKDAQSQVTELVEAAETVSSVFLAQTAVHVRERGHMKDTPALLLAVLSRRDPVLFRATFGRVITSGKMLRVFVQILRSGRLLGRTATAAPLDQGQPQCAPSGRGRGDPCRVRRPHLERA